MDVDGEDPIDFGASDPETGLGDEPDAVEYDDDGFERAPAKPTRRRKVTKTTTPRSTTPTPRAAKRKDVFEQAGRGDADDESDEDDEESFHCPEPTKAETDFVKALLSNLAHTMGVVDFGGRAPSTLKAKDWADIFCVSDPAFIAELTQITMYGD